MRQCKDKGHISHPQEKPQSTSTRGRGGRGSRWVHYIGGGGWGCLPNLDHICTRHPHLQQQDPPRARLPGRSPKAGEQQTKTSALHYLSRCLPLEQKPVTTINMHVMYSIVILANLPRPKKGTAVLQTGATVKPASRGNWGKHSTVSMFHPSLESDFHDPFIS